jgi:hypothetical protein
MSRFWNSTFVPVGNHVVKTPSANGDTRPLLPQCSRQQIRHRCHGKAQHLGDFRFQTLCERRAKTAGNGLRRLHGAMRFLQAQDETCNFFHTTEVFDFEVGEVDLSMKFLFYMQQ